MLILWSAVVSGRFLPPQIHDSCLEEVSGCWMWIQWACSLRVWGVGSELCGHERAEVMLDRLEHLLPIPTGAEVDRWRKGWYRGEKDEKNGDMETFLCITHTNTRWVTRSRCLTQKGWVRVLLHVGHVTHLFSHSNVLTAVIFISATIQTSWLDVIQRPCE